MEQFGVELGPGVGIVFRLFREGSRFKECTDAEVAESATEQSADGETAQDDEEPAETAALARARTAGAGIFVGVVVVAVVRRHAGFSPRVSALRIVHPFPRR